MRVLLATLHSKFIHPSLALPCLAAYCRDLPVELAIREFTLHEPKESVLAALLAEEPEVVAFSVYLWNRGATLELVDALAVARPGLRIVLGGPEVSFDGADLFHRHPGLTALVRGEGELPLHGLLAAWSAGREPQGVARLCWRRAEEVVEGPDGPPLAHLDALPSPFTLGLADLYRGFVYYESSRGCPYDCSFCMSALDATVRSFSMERIHSDLGWLLAQRVAKIKLVDRTFNYDTARAREIFRFILENNRGSHLHFEIGAHLLDAATLELLEQVPADTFQFEIGVQSTLPATLAAIGRRAPLEALFANVRRLRQRTAVQLHLDLIAGLPGEGFDAFVASVDRVATLAPHHLQIEPVKLLPGSPLRREASARGIRFDPNPPYTVLATPDLDFTELERLRGLSRLFDLIVNSGRFPGFTAGLTAATGSLAGGLLQVEADWRRRGLFRHPLSQRALFEALAEFVHATFDGERRQEILELLARDFARCERVVPGKAPAFFDIDLTAEEEDRVREAVRRETGEIRGQGVKLQHFAAVFHQLPVGTGRQLRLFLYLTRSGAGLEVRELLLESGAPVKECSAGSDRD
ncbi:B12-binding domain-containing radical SAM protein [Desulfuromonas carbonis]|uniref:B12-binding domain-containing radical SAM protein n=1 Tax=Desulfuromonas sp. DDH964 TaxID=1823759 RepID=UPI00078D8546|nr:DUF4080 domain-containing protein [Desulfuromonas sp. DDH964]AMV72806.1 radical SAM domain-containing iron-sulfur cluster-binding oxidoreductase [Desulfuromonas sp. DDH964]